MTPDEADHCGHRLRNRDYRNNNALLEQVGLATSSTPPSREAAGRIGLFNTPDFLWAGEAKAIAMGRSFRLRSYNDYRERFGLRRVRSFEDLTNDGATRQRLAALYPSGIDQLEYVVGIFAEDRDEKPSLFGELLTRMVAYDAFTQILSNPLLAREIHHARTFTQYGLEVIEATDSIQTLVDRNLKARGGTRAPNLGVP